MAGRKKTAPETVEGTVVNEVAVTQPTKMEFRLINPTEGSFLREIKWNKEELEAAVKQKIAAYENVVYTEDNMKQAKADRAELNKLTKAIEDRRKKVKNIIMEPYTAFENEIKEVLELIEEPVEIIDKQVKAFEDQQKEAKKKSIQKSYDEVIGDLAEVLPFEKVFDSRYLNQTYKLATAQADVKAKVEKVRTDLETIDSLESKYKLNAKDVYIKTMDLSKALAENKRLSDLEEKLEAEKRRKAEAEAEKKRLEEERRKVAEERAAEEQRKAQAEKAKQEPVIKQPESVAEQPKNVIENPESVAKPTENVSNREENVSGHQKNVPEPASEMGKAIQSIERQAFAAAADPFEPKQPVEEMRYRTRFCAVGTKAQLEQLILFMKENGIEYGRIE